MYVESSSLHQDSLGISPGNKYIHMHDTNTFAYIQAQFNRAVNVFTTSVHAMRKTTDTTQHTHTHTHTSVVIAWVFLGNAMYICMYIYYI